MRMALIGLGNMARRRRSASHYFVDHGVRNFYSVSISGYHIAMA